MKAQDDAFIEEIAQQEIDEAKLQGLDATRKAINSWNHNEGYNWQLMAISNQTANKLIKGEFTTFDELEEYDFEYPEKSLEMLYRIIFSKNDKPDIRVIETFFIDE